MEEKNEKSLRAEIVALKGEVKQLRQAVNLLLEMVMEHDGGEYEGDFGDFKLDRNDNLKMGM